MAGWWEDFQGWREGNRAGLEGWLQENVADPMNFYLGHTGIPQRLGVANEVFNPIVGMEDAGVLTEELYETGDPTLMIPIVTEIAGALAPAAAGKIVGGTADDIANAAVDTLVGFSPGVETSAKVKGIKDASADFAADESGAIPLPMLEKRLSELQNAEPGAEFKDAMSNMNFMLEESFPGQVSTIVDGGKAVSLVDDMGDDVAPGLFLNDKGLLESGVVKKPKELYDLVDAGDMAEEDVAGMLEPLWQSQGTLEDHYYQLQLFGNDYDKYMAQQEALGAKLADEMGEGYSYLGNGSIETPDLEEVGVLDMLEGPGGDFKDPTKSASGKIIPEGFEPEIKIGDTLAGGGSVADAAKAAKKSQMKKLLNDFNNGEFTPQELADQLDGVEFTGSGFTKNGEQIWASDLGKEYGLKFDGGLSSFIDDDLIDIPIEDDLVDINFDVLDDTATGVTDLPPTVDVDAMNWPLTQWVKKGYPEDSPLKDAVANQVFQGGGPEFSSGYDLMNYLEDKGFLVDEVPANPYSNATGPVGKPFVMASGTVDDGLYLSDFTKSETGPFLGGSATKGVYDSPEGHKMVVKGYGDDAMAQNEYAASGIMEAAGLKTPGHKLISLGDELKGGVGVATEYDSTLIPFDRTNVEHIKKAQDDFALNAILGNWDSIGLEFDNTMFKPDGTPVMIDPGGALKRRAMGGVKDSTQWNSMVTEFDTMRDPTVNEAAYEVYGGMTDHQINKSIQKAYDGLTDSTGNLKYEVNKAIDNAYGANSPEGAELKTTLLSRVNDAKIRQEQYKSIDELWDDAEASFMDELTTGQDSDAATELFEEAVAENIPGAQMNADNTITHPEWGTQSAFDLARWLGLTDKSHAPFLTDERVSKVAQMGLDYLKKGEDVPLGIEGALRLDIAKADGNIVFKPKKVNGYPVLMNKNTGQEVNAMGYLQDIGFIDSYGDINTLGNWQANVGQLPDAGTKGVRKVSVPEHVKYARQVAEAIRANPRDPRITPEMESGFTAQSADWVRKNPKEWPGNLDTSPDASLRRAEAMGYTPLWHHKGGHPGPDLRTARERGGGYDFISTTTNPDFKWGGSDMTPYMGDIQRTASAESAQGAASMARDLGAPDYLADMMGEAADDITFNITMLDRGGYEDAVAKWRPKFIEELDLLESRGMINPDQKTHLKQWGRAILEREYSAIENSNFVEHMKGMGYDSFHMREASPYGQIHSENKPSSSAQNMGVIKPKALRRADGNRPALFDPRLRNKRNEFFGIGGGALTLPLLMGEEDENGTGGI